MQRWLSLLLIALLLCMTAAPLWAAPPDGEPAPKAQDDAAPADPEDAAAPDDPKAAPDDPKAAPDDPKAAPDAGKSAATTIDDLDKMFKGKRVVFITSLVLKYVPLLIGVVLLVLLYLRNDKIRGGLIPKPAAISPTVPVKPGEAFWLCVAAFFVLPFVLQMALLPDGSKGQPLWLLFLVTGLGVLPVAFVVVFRRLRLARPRPPSVGKGSALGAGTFCIAIAVLIPVAFVWVLLLWKLGHPPQVQELVTKALKPDNPDDPYIIAFYGVLVAPFAEEAIFRGMLYPLGRRLMGDTKRAAIMSGLITATLFAAIHMSLSAFVPLLVLALVLTWVFEKTNSLTAVVVAHGLNNLTSLLPLLMYHWV